MVELTQICVNGALFIAGSRETPKKLETVLQIRCAFTHLEVEETATMSLFFG
jgi:hypothetical protein